MDYTNTDTIIIASINNDTKVVKLVSIYRDTYLNIGEDRYGKANAAYANGGYKWAINMLNQNLDLDITDFVTVNMNALVEVVDALGGFDFDLTDEEVVHMNNYCVGTSEITGKSYERIEPEVAGTYHLNGVQAVSYTRIRYTAGNDYKRTERQRELIAKIVAKAKKSRYEDAGRYHGQCVPDDFHQSQQIGYCISGNEYVVLSAGGYLRIPV